MVVVIDNNIKQSFDARTDMKWVDVLNEVHNHFRKLSSEIQLVYHISKTGVMLYLADKNEWDKPMCQLQERIKAAWTCAVSMEIKNIVSGMCHEPMPQSVTDRGESRKHWELHIQVQVIKLIDRSGPGRTLP